MPDRIAGYAEYDDHSDAIAPGFAVQTTYDWRIRGNQ
jgi:hypothetical protein